MLIGWATPFNVRSAIGKFSRAVAEELSTRGQDVVIVRLETGPELQLNALETHLPVISAGDADVQQFEEMVVNFGNHAPYHSQCVSLIAQRAPLAIFHDAEMRDFEWGLRYRHAVELPRLEGLDEASIAQSSADDFVGNEARSLLASLAAMSWGAVVHGPHYHESVAAYCPGPVRVIPLCYPDPGIAREPPPTKRGRRVIIFGVINQHKQPRRVIRAVAALKEQIGPIEIHLAGAIEDAFRGHLIDECKKLGINPPVIHGYVSDELLQELIENAQAVCCLRYPVTEGGSASLATALYRQRPLIIPDVASYAMVPDELAYKVSYGEDSDDVADALLRIFENQSEAEGRARRGRAWAEDHFSAHAYVDALLPLLEGHRPNATLAKLARDLVPAIVAPDDHVMTMVVPDFAEVLDWMKASQATVDA